MLSAQQSEINAITDEYWLLLGGCHDVGEMKNEARIGV